MATTPARGDVWLVDLGLAAKTRPCLVLSIPPDDDHDRRLVTVVPHTTSTRGSRFEAPTNERFLKAGAFDAQNLVTIPVVKLIRRLGSIREPQFATVCRAVRHWLGLDEVANP